MTLALGLLIAGLLAPVSVFFENYSSQSFITERGVRSLHRGRRLQVSYVARAPLNNKSVPDLVQHQCWNPCCSGRAAVTVHPQPWLALGPVFLLAGCRTRHLSSRSRKSRTMSLPGRALYLRSTTSHTRHRRGLVRLRPQLTGSAFNPRLPLFPCLSKGRCA